MKLVRKDKFNRVVGKRIEMPYPADQLGATLTVMILKTGHVELFGFIENEEASVKLLELGIARLKHYHEVARASRRTKNIPLLLGPDGQPITSPAEHA